MIKYDDLKKAAVEVRAEMTGKGLIDPSAPKIRKKPRDVPKKELLYLRAINRMNKYPPRLAPDNRLILPYFKSV
jgi:hypothetical protein